MPTPAKHAARPDSGFTLVELIVAMVITLIVVFAVARPLLGGVDSVNHQSAATSAHEVVTQVTEQLRQDLETARAPERTVQTIRSPESLADALVAPRGTARNEDPSSTTPTIDVYDIIAATPTELAFQGEVDSTHDGPECVDWLVNRSGSTFSVVRTVSATAGGGVPGSCSGQLSQRTIVRPQSYLGDDASAPMFTYRVECNSAAQPNWAGTGSCSGSCNAVDVASAGQPLVNAIVSVNVDVSAAEARGGQGARSTRSVEIPLPSRNTQMYRMALGCA